MHSQITEHIAIISEHVATEELDLLVGTYLVDSTEIVRRAARDTYDVVVTEELYILVSDVARVSCYLHHRVQQLYSVEG